MDERDPTPRQDGTGGAEPAGQEEAPPEGGEVRTATPPPPSRRTRAPAEAQAEDEEPRSPTGDIRIQRYPIREIEGRRHLACIEAPSMAVRVERGLTVPASALRNQPPGSIYLDGAGEGAPFLDFDRHVFNLNHHGGCVRSFTLSTCEQALVLVRKGLDLKAREWTIHANEPDLDTVLAIWVLLNHVRLSEDAEVLSRVTPLVRLEGNIDVHGLALQDLCGFPEKLRKQNYHALEELRRRELAVKRGGRWGKVDYLEYTAHLLRTLDELVYVPEDLKDVRPIEELARAEVAGSSLAVVCKTEDEIYAAEPRLRRLYGERLGVIALQKDETTYTLRQSDPFLPATLEHLYEHLNLMDPAAGGRSSGNRWGGSAEIGGSHRKTGTRLSPREIADACKEVFRRSTPMERVSGMARAAAVAAGVLLAAWLLAFGPELLAASDPPPSPALRHGLFAGLLALLSAGTFATVARLRPGLFGLHAPSRWDPLLLAPLAVGAGLAGGAWGAVPFTAAELSGGSSPWAPVLMALAMPFAAEMLFRGVAWGFLIRGGRQPGPRGAWRLSRTAAATALFYLLASMAILAELGSVGELAVPLWHLPLRLGALLVLGLLTGLARDRSESLLLPLLLHWLAALGTLVLPGL